MMISINRIGRILFLLFTILISSACSSLIGKPTPTVEPEVDESFSPIVSATGIVVPTQWAELSMSTAGVISEILVSEDEVVRADQILLRLEGKENLQAAISAANLELVTAQRALDDLYKDPELLSSSASQAIVQAERAIDDAQERVNNLLEASDQTDVDQAKANLVLAKDKLDKAQEDYEPYENKPEDNLVRAAMLSKVAQARKQYDSAVRLLNNLVGEANNLDLKEAQSNLELAQAQLVAAQSQFEKVKEGPDPADITLAKTRLANAVDQLAAAKAILDDLELRAPFDGTVSEVKVRPSEWVVPGQQVVTLADLSHLRVETTDLNEIDVAQLEVGNSATVTFDALPGVEVMGTVVRISPKAAEGAGVNYTVVVEFEEIPPQLKWGMTAFVDIEVGK